MLLLSRGGGGDFSMAEPAGAAAQRETVRAAGEIARGERGGVEIFNDGEIEASELVGEFGRREEELEGLSGLRNARGQRIEHELFDRREYLARLRVVEHQAGTHREAAEDADRGRESFSRQVRHHAEPAGCGG